MSDLIERLRWQANYHIAKADAFESEKPVMSALWRAWGEDIKEALARLREPESWVTVSREDAAKDTGGGKWRGWAPIATAPRDGEVIDLINKDGHRSIDVWRTEDECWGDVTEDRHWIGRRPIDMDLPQPPREGDNEVA